MSLNHINKDGNAIMVDVTNKDVSQRVATATGIIYMEPKTLERIFSLDIKKGDVLAVAQVAGIMAAKKTSSIIPMCHPLNLTGIDIKYSKSNNNSAIHIKAIVKVTGQTGVEMEALTAVSIAALTIYDMCKAIDKNMVIGDIKLVEKSGGKSGIYRRL